MILKILALIDVHTFLVLIFSQYLPIEYIIAGATFPILKGIIFLLNSKDLFSMLDIIVGLMMLFLLIGPLWLPIFIFIFIYQLYKIMMSFAF